MLGVSVLIYLFHKYSDKPKKMLLSMLILITVQVIMIVAANLASGNISIVQNLSAFIGYFALSALLLIYRYNGEKGRNVKYLFYIFYPGHLLILYFIYKLIT